MSYNFRGRIPGFFRIICFDAFQQLFMQVLRFPEISSVFVYGEKLARLLHLPVNGAELN